MGQVDLDQFITATALAVSSISAVFSSAVSAGSLLVTITGTFNQVSASFSTVTDNINTAGFTARVLSTMVGVSDTKVHVIIHDKVVLSSGAAASTYRISVNYSGASQPSLCAALFTGSTFTFGSTGSSNGTSTGPRGPIQTASSTPVLFLSGAVHNSTSIFGSTVGGPLGTFLTTVDPTNANQVLNIVYSTNNTSLSQQLTHSMTSSTAWLAGTVLYTGQTAAAGGAATGWLGSFALTGVQ